MRLSLRALAAAAALITGCPDRPAAPPPRDAAADRPRDVLTARSSRRRRGRARVRAAGNNAASSAARTTGENVLSPANIDETGEAPPRPRVTETGPMLPEDLGPPPSVTLDMGSEQQGPMGLEPAQISRGMDPLLPRSPACAEATTDEQGRGPHGRVTVRMRIRNDGHPTAARVSGGGGTAEFITCARRVAASARFARFNGPDIFATWGFDVD